MFICFNSLGFFFLKANPYTVVGKFYHDRKFLFAKIVVIFPCVFKRDYLFNLSGLIKDYSTIKNIIIKYYN